MRDLQKRVAEGFNGRKSIADDVLILVLQFPQFRAFIIGK